MRLTERQLRMLREMASLCADQAWLVGGQNRTACVKLARLGLAKSVGSDGALGEAFAITESGRRLLSEEGRDG